MTDDQNNNPRVTRRSFGKTALQIGSALGVATMAGAAGSFALKTIPAAERARKENVIADEEVHKRAVERVTAAANAQPMTPEQIIDMYKAQSLAIREEVRDAAYDKELGGEHVGLVTQSLLEGAALGAASGAAVIGITGAVVKHVEKVASKRAQENDEQERS